MNCLHKSTMSIGRMKIRADPQRFEKRFGRLLIMSDELLKATERANEALDEAEKRFNAGDWAQGRKWVKQAHGYLRAALKGENDE